MKKQIKEIMDNREKQLEPKKGERISIAKLRAEAIKKFKVKKDKKIDIDKIKKSRKKK